MLIVCSQTGTVLEAEHCLLLNPDKLSIRGRDEWEEADGSDSDTSRVAKKHGVPVAEILEQYYQQEHLISSYKFVSDATRKELENRSLRSGDLTWNNTIPYSPTSLREICGNFLEDELGGTYTENTYKALYYGANFANDEWFVLVAELALNDDRTWLNYKPSIIDAITMAYTRTNGGTTE